MQCLCKWMSDQGLGYMVTGQKLLRAKEGWEIVESHGLKEHEGKNTKNSATEHKR